MPLILDQTLLADELYEQLKPLAEWSTPDVPDHDAVNDWPFLKLVRALTFAHEEVDQVARESDDGPGWSVLVDVDRAPVWALPWLAQAVGVRLVQGSSEVEQRQRIKDAGGVRRGRPATMRAVVEATLTGTKTVFLIERHGSAYRLTVATFASETPDPAATEAAALEQKPAGLVFNYSAITGLDYISLRDTHQDYDAVESVFTDYADVLADPTQQS